MNKKHFCVRMEMAGAIARQFAASYVLEPFADELCFTISPHNDPRGRPGFPGTIKFLGGRLLNLSDLNRLKAARAAALLWVDGKVPAWINIGVFACLEMKTEMLLRFSGTLVAADENELPPDVGCPKGNHLVPFRIRSPGPPVGWRSVELDGRVSLVAARAPVSEDTQPGAEPDPVSY